MHEFSIAENIIKTAQTEAAKHGGKHIAGLNVRLGKADHLEAESLEFCLKAQAKGTIAENARIVITPLENEPGVYLESIELD